VLGVDQVIYWDCLESRALPQFVREQLIRLHRVTGRCLYAACDIVIPCNATFNTKWEVSPATGSHDESVRSRAATEYAPRSFATIVLVPPQLWH
jgi:hypothetical protein